jgi:hypothetical protein
MLVLDPKSLRLQSANSNDKADAEVEENCCREGVMDGFHSSP